MPTFVDILHRLNQAHELKDKAEKEGSEDYYYWDGYITALDYVTDGYQPSVDDKD
jgi:hypothetical protein